MDPIIKNVYCSAIKNVRFDLLLLICNLMNIAKNYTIIHLQLSYIDVLEVVILLLNYLMKYVFQKKQKI